MKKLFLLLALALPVALFTSCDDDDRHEYYIEDDMVGRTWTGSVGQQVQNGEPIFSSFSFGRDGFGEEIQYYVSDGEFYAKYRFSWRRVSGYSNDFMLDYGREFGISFMDDLQIYNGIMSGVFYFEETSEGFRFRLSME